MNALLLASLPALSLVRLLVPAASAATLTVGASGYPSIQSAIDAAGSGDLVLVDPGVWAGTTDFGGRALTVRSRDGAATTTLVGGGGGWTVLLQNGEPAGAVLDGFTIANPGGAGVYVGGNAHPTLQNLAFVGNGAYGAWLPALQVSGGGATVTDATFEGNGSQYGGALLVDNGAVDLTRVSFAQDIAWNGGAIFVWTAGSAALHDCAFAGEEAAVSGGAIYVVAGASLVLDGTTFDENQADAGGGGAVYAEAGAVVSDVGGRYAGNTLIDYATLGTNGGAVYGASATLSFAGTTFDTNTGYRGGAVYASGGTVALDAATFSANYAIQGGAVWLSDGAALVDNGSLWDKNTSYDIGGAVAGYGTFQADHVNATFSDNLSTYNHGGAWYGYLGTFTCTGCSFLGNTAYYYGGALFFSELYSSATIVDTTFDQNRSTYGYGGAIYAQYYSDLLISGSTFTANLAYQGGGVYAYYRTDLRVTDSSFAWNTADTYAGGAMVASDSGLSDSTLRIERVELADNTSTNEGGAVVALGMDQVIVQDDHFLRNTAGNRSFGGAVFARGNASLLATGNRFTSNAAGYGGAVYLDTPGRNATWTNNQFTENVAGIGGAFAAVGGGEEVWTNNTFVGNGATDAGGTVAVHGTSIRFRNNVVAWTDPGAAVHDYSPDTAAKADYAYNSWFGNAGGDASGEAGDPAAARGSVAKDPMLVGYSRDGDDTNDNLRLLRDSPLLDVGDPALSDPDGTRSDIGAYGGPGALAGDNDGDGSDAASDCDDADATIHPGAADPWYDGVNQDCAGASDYDQDGDGVDAAAYGGEDCDDTDPRASDPCAEDDTGDHPAADGAAEAGGCGCATGRAGGAGGWLVVGVILGGLARRRSLPLEDAGHRARAREVVGGVDVAHL